MRKRGWYGHPVEHSMAARGIRLYAKRKEAAAMFYAVKRESSLPFAVLFSEVKAGKTYNDLLRAYPDQDPSDLRRRGLRAIEVLDADNTLSKVDASGVDEVVVLARGSPSFRGRVLRNLGDAQRSSFLPAEKVRSLEARASEMG